jgi:hypothetical protein
MDGDLNTKKFNPGGVFSLIKGDKPDRDVEVMSRTIAEKKQHDEAIERANKLLIASIDSVDERKEKIHARLKNKLKRSKSRK